MQACIELDRQGKLTVPENWKKKRKPDDLRTPVTIHPNVHYNVVCAGGDCDRIICGQEVGGTWY